MLDTTFPCRALRVRATQFTKKAIYKFLKWILLRDPTGGSQIREHNLSFLYMLSLLHQKQKKIYKCYNRRKYLTLCIQRILCNFIPSMVWYKIYIYTFPVYS